MTTSSERGNRAEDLAVRTLIERGYEILARNVRVAGGEIDVIATQGDVLCFVEVRSVSDPKHGDPLETITPLKIRRLVKAAQGYLATLPPPWPTMRFDAVGVVLTQPPTVELVQDAFEAW